MNEPNRTEAAERLVCAECGRVPDADENAADEWHAYRTASAIWSCSAPTAQTASSGRTSDSVRVSHQLSGAMLRAGGSS
jgi:hypothetical protein